MVTWTIFKTPFLEVGLTQNRETMAILLQSLRVWDVYVSKATSYTRLRAHDHYTSRTLTGGKGGAGPSSLHTMLEGPT